MSIENKVAVITGGAQGIGKAVAKKFSGLSIKTAIVDINLEIAEETSSQISGSRPYKANVADFNEINKVMEQIINDFGNIDILVNNAGITRDTLLMRMSEEDWDAVININLKGAFNCSKSVIRTMMKNRWGRIVNISSIIGIIGNAGQVNYSASKAGIIGMTKSIAKEVASRNITVNAIAPGFIQTMMTDAIPEKDRDKLIELIPQKKLGQPEDISNAAAFLISEEAHYITGQVLVVDGGMSM